LTVSTLFFFIVHWEYRVIIEGSGRSGPGGRAVGPGLRDELVREALRLVEEAGADSLSLRAVAKAIGVSQTAPYLHFADGVTEMLAAVASIGFERLIDTLEGRGGRSVDPPAVEAAVRYVRFGVENPNLYRAMFSARLADPLESLGESLGPADRGYQSYWSLQEVKQRAYQALVLPLEEMDERGLLRPGDPWEFGLAVAALAHGLVGEFIDEGLGMRASREQAWSPVRATMTREVVLMLFEGLMARGRER